MPPPLDTQPKHIYNPIKSQWGLPFSWTTLGGKHRQHPIVLMGVVDTLGLNIKAMFAGP